MKRKIYEDILKWKSNSAGRTALLIDGARLVGKSYVAKQFAIAEYKSAAFRQSERRERNRLSSAVYDSVALNNRFWAHKKAKSWHTIADDTGMQMW